MEFSMLHCAQQKQALWVFKNVSAARVKGAMHMYMFDLSSTEEWLPFQGQRRRQEAPVAGKAVAAAAAAVRGRPQARRACPAWAALC